VRSRERNPFPYGRELSPRELVDREDELAEIGRTIDNRGKLFLIGPRRYGKTSLLAAAAEEARGRGARVLRIDAERYETLPLLAQALLTAAARELRGPVERVLAALNEAAGRLRPELGLDPTTGGVTVSLGLREEDPLPLFGETLDAVERLASKTEAPVAVLLDEVQAIVVEHGRPAERQLRSVVQRHRHTAYVFAGSATRLLAEMTEDPERPFWRLGARLFVREIPREEFHRHLRETFEASGMAPEEAGIDAILHRADEVPYNVERLAHEVWELLRVADDPTMTPASVDHALVRLLGKEDPAYAQLWSSLSQNQKKAVKAIMETDGRGLASAAVARRFQIASSSLRTALRQLEDLHVVRGEHRDGEPRFRLIDPFLSAWVRHSQGPGAVGGPVHG